MSFLDRARQAAAQAAEGAKQAAEQARTAASETAGRAQTAISDPGNAEKAKAALSRAKRGVSTAIDRIDPNVLADVIIKATALQERANAALKAKGSPYRVAEVVIGAAIPPSISFSIARTHDLEADIVPEGAVASTQLLAGGVGAEPETVRALDGSTVDEASLEADEA
jgi:hypothetical protein